MCKHKVKMAICDLIDYFTVNVTSKVWNTQKKLGIHLMEGSLDWGLRFTHFVAAPRSSSLSWRLFAPAPPSPARLCTGGSSRQPPRRTCSRRRSRRGEGRRWSRRAAIRCSSVSAACPIPRRPDHGTWCPPSRPWRRGQRATWALVQDCRSCTSGWSTGSQCGSSSPTCPWCSAIQLQGLHSRRRGPWTAELPGCRIW